VGVVKFQQQPRPGPGLLCGGGEKAVTEDFENAKARSPLCANGLAARRGFSRSEFTKRCEKVKASEALLGAENEDFGRCAQKKI